MANAEMWDDDRVGEILAERDAATARAERVEADVRHLRAQLGHFRDDAFRFPAFDNPSMVREFVERTHRRATYTLAALDSRSAQREGFRQCAVCGDDIWPNEPDSDTCAICQARGETHHWGEE